MGFDQAHAGWDAQLAVLTALGIVQAQVRAAASHLTGRVCG
jgi:hypothetical protein